MILSIITPCYNSEEFIEEAIYSIIAQNNNNIELILIDDGSTDNTESICKKYINKNIFYKKIVNSGAGYARNVGIQHARGKWIAFLDSDDLYLINSINEQVINLLEEYYKNKVDIIYTPRMKIDIYLNEIPQITYPEEIEYIKNYMPKLEFWTCIYNIEFIKENNIKFYEYRKQDVESAFRFLAFSNAKKIIKNNKIKFYLQRDNLNSNTHTWNLYNLYEIKSKIYYDLYIKSYNKDIKVKKYLLEITINHIYMFYILCLKRGYFLDKKQVQDMHILLNDISKCIEINLIDKSFKIKLNILRVIDRFYKIIFIRKNKREINKSNSKNKKNNLNINSRDIIYRLNKISNEIVNNDSVIGS